MPKSFTVKVKKLPGSLVEIEGEISAEEFARHKEPALKKLGEKVSLPGFRRGHIPEAVLVKHAGEMELLEEMAELAIKKSYPDIIVECALNIIGFPEVKITKLAFGNPLSFSLAVPVMPEIILPDYKETAREENGKMPEKTEVKGEEADALLEELRKNFQKPEGGDEKEIKLNDEFARKIGDFKDLADLKEKAKEGISKEKEMKARDRRRLTILEEIIKETKIDLPEVIINSELSKMTARFRGDIEETGMKFDEYLERAGKTEDDLRKEWREDAKKRASFQLILNKITSTENIKADKDAVEKESAHILEHHPEINPLNARAYAEMILTNEKVFEFLENVK